MTFLFFIFWTRAPLYFPMSKKATTSSRGQVSKPVRTRFPASRIKKIMQSDEDVGKVAKETPVVVSRALELFVEHLLAESIGEETTGTLTPYHIKKTVNENDLFDFLKDTVSSAPDAPTPTQRGRKKKEVETTPKEEAK
eukprot:TRINITY_DN984_c0_g1_i1.p1 TRINITY_DN984_c0_g1~~TRINITY_DN984_c0_g1_i1.p1  ORF type:complete len:139 (+),score=25.65 TRINITY_DN984_c0_g1_i1:16-432(+)